jgi:hypothetical protein
MKLVERIRSSVGGLFRREFVDAETDEEMRVHIQNRADDLERSGLVRAEAERRA